jgi:hypothetical protein
MLWNEMKNYVRAQFCKTPEEVVSAINTFNKNLTTEKLQNYINKIHEVLIRETKYKNINFLNLKYQNFYKR